LIPELRARFNGSFSPARYQSLLARIEEACGVPTPFRVSETPCFFPSHLLERLARAGGELIAQLVGNPEYESVSARAVPAAYDVPGEPAHPLFVQVDFGLIRDERGEIQPRLVEIQGFPSLYAYQVALAEAYLAAYGLDLGLRYLPGGLDAASYRRLLGRAILGGHDAENVILMDIDPRRQKTLPDFTATEKWFGVPAVCITQLHKRGRRLFYRKQGRLIPVERIYNRAIVDELERRRIRPAFDFRDDIEVEWAGHPNFYFRISKFSLPYLSHPTAPRAWFLDRIDRLPENLDRYVLKPLFSFAGAGVVIGPTRAEIEAIPPERRGEFILQERVDFEPVIETPHGPTQAEIRIMYIWLEKLEPVSTIIRMGRGKMMGVDHNRDMEWVGASAALSQR